jgi:uncharacterized protein (DUF2267 family)
MGLNFNQYAKEANSFLKDYTKQMSLNDDVEKAGRILSSVLHGLRAIISTEESLQFMAQLPMFLKAVYVNGWTLKEKRRVKSMVDFIDLIRKYDGKTSIHDFESDEKAENYLKTTFIVLRKYVSLGELEDIRNEIPKDLKFIIYQNIMF